MLANYVEATTLVEPIDVPRIVPTDPDDDHVIATALAAQADFVVSGDADLLSLGSYGNLAIVTAADAVSRINPSL